MSALDIVIRLLGKDVSASATVKKTTQDVKDLYKELRKDGVGKGMARAEASAKSYNDGVAKAKQQTENLTESLGRVRNAGLGMAAAGGGVMLLENHLIGVAQEGDAAESKLEAMLNKRGEGGRADEMKEFSASLANMAALSDDDPINAASAGLLGFSMNADRIKGLMPGLIGQTRLYNQGLVDTAKLTATAEAVGRAYGKGDVTGLARVGVTLSDDDLARIQALKDRGASQDERQAAIYEILKNSFSQYALSMTEGLSQSEIAANRLALAFDTTQTELGRGAGYAKSELDGVLTNVLGIINEAPGFLHAAGYLGYFGGMALTAGGTVLGLASQASMGIIALQGMGVTGVGALTAIKVAAASTYAFLAPLILPILAIAAAMIAVQRIAIAMQHKKQAAAEAEGDKTDREFYDKFKDHVGKTGKRYVNAGESFEDWRKRTGRGNGAENSDDTEDPANQQKALDDVQASMEKMKAGLPAPGQMPSMAPAGAAFSAPSGASNNIESLQDQIAHSRKGYDPNSAQEQLRMAQRGQKHEGEATRAATRLSNQQKADAKKRDAAQKKADREGEKASDLQDRIALEDQIDGLTDQLHHTRDKSLKKQLQDQITMLRRAARNKKEGRSGGGVSSAASAAGGLFDRFKNGGSIYDGADTEGSGSGSGSSSLPTSVNAEQVSQRTLGNGDIEVRFRALLPRSPFERAALAG